MLSGCRLRPVLFPLSRRSILDAACVGQLLSLFLLFSSGPEIRHTSPQVTFSSKLLFVWGRPSSKFSVDSLQLTVISRKFQVYSRKLVVSSRKELGSSYQLADPSGQFSVNSFQLAGGGQFWSFFEIKSTFGKRRTALAALIRASFSPSSSVSRSPSVKYTRALRLSLG